MGQNLSQEEAVFQAALELEVAGERAAYLEAACASEPELRRRVEALLRRCAESQGPLDRPAPSIVTTADEPLVECPGTIIGPYKLMEQIGEGGMGLVFVAEQQRPVRRKVALKVIKPGMDTRAVIARFEAERQALALMDHPNIAKVLDGGTIGGEPGGVSSGRPFFVMELVKGVPITQFCDDNCFSTRERLELFSHVCDAVQHAHQKGIIHRDIKPTNVLVISADGKPVVKVIDFGVAKAIGQQLTDKTIYTQFSQLLGTPLYMSPEQAGESGLDVDTRTDIYALGVLLYELLTGTTPFDKERFKEAGYDEMRRIIREEEPPKPSTRISTLGQAATTVSAQRKTDPKRLSQLFRGELDWIVMKCLEKDRDRRYETASALAADVQRFLHDEPVQACPPSAIYRFRKLARRHRAALTMTSLVLLLLVAGLSVGLVAVNQEQKRTQAALSAEARRREQARQALDAMSSEIIDEWLAKQQELLPEHKKFLEQVLASYEEFAADTGQDEPARAGVAAAYHRVGVIREQLGQTAEAEAAYRQAQALFEQLASDFSMVPKYAQNLAENHLRLGILLEVVNHHEEALAAHQQGLTIFRRLAADFPSIPEYREGLALSYHNLAIVLCSLGRTDEVWQVIGQALMIQQKLAADFPGVPKYRLRLASLKLYWGRSDDQGLTIMKKLAVEFPNERKIRVTLARGLYLRGLKLADTDRNQEALAAYQQALALEEKLAVDFPSVPQFRMSLAATRTCAGQTLAKLGCHEDARAAFQQALRIYKQLAADFPHVPQYAVEVGNAVAELDGLSLKARGLSYAEIRRFDEAAADFAKALSLVPGCKHPWWSDREGIDRELVRRDEVFRRVTELRPRDLQLWIARVCYYGRRSQWRPAAAAMEKVIELGSWDHLGWYQEAGLRLALDDTEGYRRACREMLTRFGLTKDPYIAERAANTCLLMPGAVSDLKPVIELAEQAARAWTQMELGDQAVLAWTEKPFDEYRWFALAKGMADYRSGRFQSAITWLSKSLSTDSEDREHRFRNGMAYLFLAMAHQQLSEPEKGCAALDQASSMTRPASAGDLGTEWYEWLRFQIVRREAEAVVNKASGPADTDRKRTKH
jgi:serine/threonine protein kinase